jgi:hypothetical protein
MSRKTSETWGTPGFQAPTFGMTPAMTDMKIQAAPLPLRATD